MVEEGHRHDRNSVVVRSLDARSFRQARRDHSLLGHVVLQVEQQQQVEDHLHLHRHLRLRLSDRSWRTLWRMVRDMWDLVFEAVQKSLWVRLKNLAEVHRNVLVGHLADV